jgi:hypothetical protein
MFLVSLLVCVYSVIAIIYVLMLIGRKIDKIDCKEIPEDAEYELGVCISCNESQHIIVGEIGKCDYCAQSVYTNEKYLLSFWIEWGGCAYLWAINKKAKNQFSDGDNSHICGCGGLPVSQELEDELDALDTEYQTALDWDYPPDPSPWTKEQAIDFKKRVDAAFIRLVKELGSEFEVMYKLGVPYGDEILNDIPQTL